MTEQLNIEARENDELQKEHEARCLFMGITDFNKYDFETIVGMFDEYNAINHFEYVHDY